MSTFEALWCETFRCAFVLVFVEQSTETSLPGLQLDLKAIDDFHHLKCTTMQEQASSVLQKTSELTIRGAAEARNMQAQEVTSTSTAEEVLEDRIEPQASTSAVTLENGHHEDDAAVPRVQQCVKPSKLWGLAEYGIPPPPADILPDPAVEAKLRHFHALRAQGVFFNNSLQSNKSFRNPSILSKLVDFVNVDEKISAIPLDIWSSSHGVSPQAWAASIAERQKQESEERERAQQRGKRSGIDFSSSSSTRDRPRERLGVPESSSRANQRPKEDRKPSRWDKADPARRSEHSRYGDRKGREFSKDSRQSQRTRSRSPASRRY